ncbi:hypothetical protein BDR03DRAFT_1019551 [Suillus americanus]|nr:hypothetical protein BDR03DRAFT_1019551 [Suillus americanus]
MESEDDDDSVIQPLSCGVPEVVLPRLSTIVARTPNLPRSPRAPTKKPFGPARVIASSHPAVMEPSQPTPEPPVQAPPVMPVVDILIPSPVKQPMLCLPQAQLAMRHSVGQEDQGSMYVVRLLHDKEDQVHPREYGIPASSRLGYLYHPKDEADDTIRRPLPPKHPAPPKLPLPPNPRPELITQTRGHSKTITAIKPPAPAPAPAPAATPLPSSRSAVPAAAPGRAVPAAALGVPMLDLHAMSHAIRDATARIALLKARVAEQDGTKSSTGTPHSHFLTLLPMQHPCCLINLAPAPCHPQNLHSPSH